MLEESTGFVGKSILRKEDQRLLTGTGSLWRILNCRACFMLSLFAAR